MQHPLRFFSLLSYCSTNISFASSFEHWAHKSTLPLRNRHGWADKDWNWGSPFGTAHDEAICNNTLSTLHTSPAESDGICGLEAMALRERLDTKETAMRTLAAHNPNRGIFWNALNRHRYENTDTVHEPIVIVWTCKNQKKNICWTPWRSCTSSNRSQICTISFWISDHPIGAA